MTDSATSERACQSARADGTPSAPGLMTAGLELFFELSLRCYENKRKVDMAYRPRAHRHPSHPPPPRAPHPGREKGE